MAEKALKALLVYAQVEFPRTHSIEELMALCETAEKPCPAAVRPAATLTRFGVAVRYPPDAILSEEAARAADLANSVLDWVLAQLPPEARP